MTFFEAEYSSLIPYVHQFIRDGKTSEEMKAFLIEHTKSPSFIPRYADDLVRLAMESFEEKKALYEKNRDFEILWGTSPETTRLLQGV